MKNYFILVLLFMNCLQSKSAKVASPTQQQNRKLLQSQPKTKDSSKILSHSISANGKPKSRIEASKPIKKNLEKNRKLPLSGNENVSTTTTSEVSESSIEQELEASTEKLDQPAKTIQYTMEELDHDLTESIQKLREVSERLNSEKHLFEKTKSKSKNVKEIPEDVDLSDFIFASATLKAGNRSIKHYIDHFVLTPDVMEKYDAFLKTKKGHKSSTEDVLQFMIHTYKNLGLRKHEMSFLKHAIEYNILLEEFYSNYIYLPLSNKIVDAFESKILDGVKLAMFVKQYLALVRSIKDNINYLDYENMDELFYPSPPKGSGTVGPRLVYKEGEKQPEASKKRNDIIPIKIIIGNDKYGDKKKKKTKPSDVIQAGVEFHPQLSNLDLSDIPDEQKRDFIQKELGKLNGSDRMTQQVTRMNDSLINDSELANALSKTQIIDQKSASNKIEQENENQENELERLLGKQSHENRTNKDEPRSSFFSSFSPSENKEQNPTKSQHQAEPEKTVVPSPFDATFIKHPSKLRDIDSANRSELQKTLQDNILDPQGPVHMMPSGIAYDSNQMPVNLEIHRVPEIEKIDTKYEDTKHSFLGFEASRVSMLKSKDPDMADTRKKFRQQLQTSGPLRMATGDVWADNMPVQASKPNQKQTPVINQSPGNPPRSLGLAPQFNGRFIEPLAYPSYNMQQVQSRLMNRPEILREQPKSLLANKTDAVYRELLKQQI